MSAVVTRPCLTLAQTVYGGVCAIPATRSGGAKQERHAVVPGRPTTLFRTARASRAAFSIRTRKEPNSRNTFPEKCGHNFVQATNDKAPPKWNEPTKLHDVSELLPAPQTADQAQSKEEHPISKPSTEEEKKDKGKKDIALGVTEHLREFRAAVAPQAFIYTEWKTQELASSNEFTTAFHEVISKARTIYVNLEGIPDVAQAVKDGQRGPYVAFLNRPSNYTSYELFILSLKSDLGNPASGDTPEQFANKIKWYEGTTKKETPKDFSKLWMQ